jgi:hypothetical protein
MSETSPILSEEFNDFDDIAEDIHDQFPAEFFEDAGFTSEQIDAISKLLLDLGKLVTGAVIVGYFIPGFSSAVSLSAFAAGGLISGLLYVAGIGILKKKY